MYFINVGQGDSILIQNKNNIVLIDTGGVNNIDLASETLIPFMRSKQINHIDALITTHNDSDHCGAALSLMENFPVYNYLPNKDQFPYQIGEIYLKNINTYSFTEDNDNSLVFNLDFMNKKWLLMGDASTLVEKRLIENNIDIDCDILKVGHHGSKTSTSEAFIKAASPQEAIISVGAKNYYGHPSESVIDLLAKYNVTIRRTDIEGTISYTKFTI
ncbi:MAG: MBL fold metallo-hydrolase [Bacilli bacterium]|nr:MBL fold metallo-hydrolase [Bacilli bacterium]